MKHVYDDLGLKYVFQSFFCSKDYNFCPDILLFFRGKTSGHDFVWTIILNTVMYTIHSFPIKNN